MLLLYTTLEGNTPQFEELLSYANKSNNVFSTFKILVTERPDLLLPFFEMVADWAKNLIPVIARAYQETHPGKVKTLGAEDIVPQFSLLVVETLKISHGITKNDLEKFIFYTKLACDLIMHNWRCEIDKLEEHKKQDRNPEQTNPYELCSDQQTYGILSQLQGIVTGIIKNILPETLGLDTEIKPEHLVTIATESSPSFLDAAIIARIMQPLNFIDENPHLKQIIAGKQISLKSVSDWLCEIHTTLVNHSMYLERCITQIAIENEVTVIKQQATEKTGVITEVVTKDRAGYIGIDKIRDAICQNNELVEKYRVIMSQYDTTISLILTLPDQDSGFGVNLNAIQLMKDFQTEFAQVEGRLAKPSFGNDFKFFSKPRGEAVVEKIEVILEKFNFHMDPERSLFFL